MKVPMKVLVTGGAGYIGSITAKALEQAGHMPVILDSLLTGPQVFVRDRIFYEGDIADRRLLARVVEEHPDLEATIHMAARIVVPESVALPYEYYRDNVAKSLELFDQLEQLGKPRVLFSSSASLYAVKPDFEVTEARPARPGLAVRPDQADDGAGPRGHGGGDRPARDHPALLQPDRLRPRPRVRHLRQGALARARPAGDGGPRARRTRSRSPAPSNPTRDGTGIRDYVHVWDLARAHVRAVEKFDEVIAAAGRAERGHQRRDRRRGDRA